MVKKSLLISLLLLAVPILVVVVGINIFKEKTVTGKVIEIEKSRTVVKTKVTVLRISTNDGDYYVGAEGHDLDLRVGDEIEVSFSRWNYVARRIIGDKSIGYRTIKKYRIIKSGT